MSKEEQAKVFHEFLTDDGFRPELTEHFDVMFKFEGGTYFIVPDGDDRQYFQLSYMYFWEIENEQEFAFELVGAIDHPSGLSSEGVGRRFEGLGGDFNDIADAVDHECEGFFGGAENHGHVLGAVNGGCEPGTSPQIDGCDNLTAKIDETSDGRMSHGNRCE